MKLRNKKTGEIVDVESLGHAESLKEKNGYQVTLSWATEYENLSQCKDYHSLAELNEEWEDYKPAEPLIKDEKIRKAVRAWAEVNGVSEVFSYKAVSGCPFWYIMAYRDEGGLTLDLWGEFPKELTNDKSYTIAELCGDEEE